MKLFVEPACAVGFRVRLAPAVAALVCGLTLAGCAGTQGAASGQASTATASSEPPAPPKLCASPDDVPAALSGKPGYAQFWVTVSEAQGQPIGGLKQADFAVTVSGRSVPIDFFRADQGDAPISLVILMDESGSMRSKIVVSSPFTLRKVRDEIAQLVDKLSACDEFAVVAVGGTPRDAAARNNRAVSI